MIRFFAAHPTLANLLMIGFLAIGVFAAPTLLRETFPRVEPRKVQISVVYPGARAEDIEDAICQRIEDAVDGVTNVVEVSCEAVENRATAIVEMREGTNLDRFTADIKTEVEAITDFPDKSEQPIIRQLGRSDFVASVAVTGPRQRAELKAYAEVIKRRMLAAGIPKVEIKGFSAHQIRVEPKDALMRQLGLSIADIAAAIARQSVDLPAGALQTRGGEITIRFADERRRVSDFEGLIVVSGTDGGQIRLGELARITDRFDRDEEKYEFNGFATAILDITKTENEDTLEVIDAVRKFIAREKAIGPPDTALTITNDVSSIVRDRLQLLITNGVQGLGLVFLAMWVFFGFRYSFWITMGLPVSFAGASAIMVMLGYSINMLTMVGMLIVIGLLMDDAIVIAENIATQRAKGKSPLNAAVDGTSQVLPGVMSSFFTTICIFGSLAFLQGDIGAVLKVVPVVMLSVLIVSIVEAFVILPRHLSHSMGPEANSRSFMQNAAENMVEWLREKVVGRFVDVCVRWRYLTTGAAVGLLLISFSAIAGGVLKFSAFPELDGDVLEARVLLPQGTPLQRTEQIVQKLKQSLVQVAYELGKKQPAGKKQLIKNIAVKYSHNVDAHEQGAHVATLSVDLIGGEDRRTSNDEFLSRWRNKTGKLPDVIALKYTQPGAGAGPAGIAIDLRLQGKDLVALKNASNELQAWLRRYTGVNNILDDLRPGKSEIKITMKDGAKSLGLDARTVADQLRTAFFGTTVDEIQIGPESYEVDVRLDLADRNDLADLDYFTITTAQGDAVPLTTIANLREDRGYARINRINGVRTVTVQGDVDVRLANANEVISDTKSRFVPEFLKRHPGVSLAIEGQDKNAATTQKSMFTGFALGLIGVFLLLSFQFRSYVEPIVVMIVIPFSFIGVIFGHIAMGLDFTMPSLLGFVALAGVVVNDSILLVNFIKDRHGENTTVAQAAPIAARARFRAILLTSLTTIAGLLPILSETSIQAQILVPLVTSLAFGLLASTLLVLFVVPSLYAILDDFGLSTLARERRAKAAQG